eukprot:gnl/TRDRNA2_/TRDRNA2_167584_c6_seq1.p1 gnl/TRDRNA2_/TRDRNA2_167584_c6~~gnl/TRDRNA2_/TRDRNA2_167584_c6_seq1.p1  ORF type:complete len:162 (+),score=33.53 gnl/TRDRNA2_/TRDRNA2_167584_c6_seq1:134-619(+)
MLQLMPYVLYPSFHSLLVMLMCRGNLPLTVKHMVSGQDYTRWVVRTLMQRQEDRTDTWMKEMKHQLKCINKSLEVKAASEPAPALIYAPLGSQAGLTNSPEGAAIGIQNFQITDSFVGAAAVAATEAVAAASSAVPSTPASAAVQLSSVSEAPLIGKLWEL